MCVDIYVCAACVRTIAQAPVKQQVTNTHTEYTQLLFVCKSSMYVYGK